MYFHFKDILFIFGKMLTHSSSNTSSFLSLTSFCQLIVGVEGYCCTQSHSVTHTHSVGLLWTRDRPITGTETMLLKLFTSWRVSIVN
jgi:hypothetical protein